MLGSEVKLNVFLTSAFYGGGQLASGFIRFSVCGDTYLNLLGIEPVTCSS